MLSDAPLTNPAEDKLGRSKFAEEVAGVIIRMETDKGFVIGLHGDWGSGKTTTINFVLESIEKVASEDEKPIIIKFNPWWFSDRDQLLQQFFSSVRTSIGSIDQNARWSSLCNDLKEFSLVISSFASTTDANIGALAVLLSSILNIVDILLKRKRKARQADVTELRNKIDEGIRKLGRKILIVIDDIERLPGDDIRLIFRLVNAVANFPNTVYLLSFDRKRVAQALCGDDYGENFIEKIIQLPLELPMPDKVVLNNILEEKVREILRLDERDITAQTQGRFYEQRQAGVEPFVTTLRGINRYANALKAACSVAGDIVDPVDFMAVVAFQVFCPEFYSELKNSRDLFCMLNEHQIIFERTEEKSQREKDIQSIIDSVITKDEKKKRIVENAVKILFIDMGFQKDDRYYASKKRIFSKEAFNNYFKLSLGEGDFSDEEMKRILSEAGDQKEFEKKLLELTEEKHPASRLPRAHHFFIKMQDFVDEFIPDENIEPIVRALYNTGDRYLKYYAKCRADINEPGNDDFSFVSIRTELLEKITDLEERYRMIEKAVIEADSVYVPADDCVLFAQQHGEFGGRIYPERKTYITKEQLEKFKVVVADKIEEKAKEGTFFEQYNPEYLLYRWIEMGKKETVKEFLDGQMREDESMVGFIDLLSNEIVFPDEVRKENSISNLVVRAGSFFDDGLAGRCKKILDEEPAWLDENKKDTLKVFYEYLDKTK
ncbi:MAG TPA: P-loop NTPase fold protein [bacterium]|nr:P-loop NTPase fold protein [bacterium]